MGHEEIERRNYLTILGSTDALDRMIEVWRAAEGGIGVIQLERVPKGWKPVKTYFGDFSRPSEAMSFARREARRIVKERGYGPGARFGVYLEDAPSTRPYAEPQTCVSLFVL